MTIGGNDVGYVPMLLAAGWAAAVRSLPLIGGRLREKLDPTARDRALVEVGESLKEVGRTLRQRAPRAKVLFVDYLTLLPPYGAAPPLSDVDVALGRRVADTLERVTGERPPTPAVNGCAPRRLAASTTPGLVNRGRPDGDCRYRAEPLRCTPTRPACARWRIHVVIGAAHRETTFCRSVLDLSLQNVRFGAMSMCRSFITIRSLANVIELAGLTKVFGGTRAVDDHHAVDPRAGPSDGWHRDYRRPGRPRAQRSAAHRGRCWTPDRPTRTGRRAITCAGSLRRTASGSSGSTRCSTWSG